MGEGTFHQVHRGVTTNPGMLPGDIRTLRGPNRDPGAPRRALRPIHPIGDACDLANALFPYEDPPKSSASH
jgi:hypothetical protein